MFSTVTGGVSKNGLNIATNAQHHTSRRSTMEKDVLVVAALLLPIQIGSYCYMQKASAEFTRNRHTGTASSQPGGYEPRRSSYRKNLRETERLLSNGCTG